MTPQRRFLFVAPPLSGHVNPTAALGRALMDRGHAAAWAGSEMFLRPLLGEEAEIFRTGSKMLRDQGAGGEAAVRSLWADFVVPYARFTLTAVDKAIAEFAPDVVISDEHTPAGALAAQRRGVPWATLATSSMELGRPFRDQPELDGWILEHLRTLWAKAGLDPAGFLDPRASPHLVLALTSPALTGQDAYPPHYALVGPLLGARPSGPDFPWAALDPRRRLVIVTMGTLAGDLAADFLRRTAKALGELADVQGVLVAPLESGLEEIAPANVLVLPRVPLLDLLEAGAVAALVCHGGLNSVTEALAHRVPLVLAPIRHDQPITAAQVAAAGAGRLVDFAGAGPDEIRRAIEAVLDDPEPRTAAARVGEALRQGGGLSAAVRRLEALVPEPGTIRTDQD
ncbi:glycosyltransferase [Actinospica robiniae]|uniref:glycosyltransferase n=1 Tax=Actinospica robiniae TaxID=304901 RepID=UPI000413290C|nr:glycosyltransferase [Actinospica robiniae]